MSDDKQTIEVLVYRPGILMPQLSKITLPKNHTYRDLDREIGALIGAGHHIEHVSVLFRGIGHDMFVDEFSAINPREQFDDPKEPDVGPQPVNEAATLIYHENSRRRGDDLTNADKIHGVAVITLQKVWS